MSEEIRQRWRRHLSHGALGVVLCFFLFRIYAWMEQDDIKEAIVRSHFKPSWPDVIFLTLDGQDPSDRFIQRFRHSRVSVRKASQAIHKLDHFKMPIYF